MATFYESCQAINIDDEGFMEDVNKGVFEATNQKLKFEEWFD